MSLGDDSTYCHTATPSNSPGLVAKGDHPFARGVTAAQRTELFVGSSELRQTLGSGLRGLVLRLMRLPPAVQCRSQAAGEEEGQRDGHSPLRATRDSKTSR